MMEALMEEVELQDNYYGKTALMFARKKSNLKAVQLLFEREKDIRMK